MKRRRLFRVKWADGHKAVRACRFERQILANQLDDIDFLLYLIFGIQHDPTVTLATRDRKSDQ